MPPRQAGFVSDMVFLFAVRFAVSVCYVNALAGECVPPRQAGFVSDLVLCFDVRFSVSVCFTNAL